MLDLGAGNGWLSHHLARRGHAVAAVDISVDDMDGLAAIARYWSNTETGAGGKITPVQADFDHLPFRADQADLIVFNGSFHYSRGYEKTLRESRRILRPGGIIAILDTPNYKTAASGVAMLRERDDKFRQAYGITRSSLPSEGFMNDDRWQALRETSAIVWQKQQGAVSIRWTLRRYAAKIRGGREPATFPMFVGQRVADRARSPGDPRPVASFNASFARARLRLQFRFLLRHRLDRVVTESVAGRRLFIHPSVFNPVTFRSGRFLGESLSAALVPPGSALLDLGTGSGVGAVVASEWARLVVAVDINPEAVRCARTNAAHLGLSGRIDVREGDLFQPVEGEKFDVILFNPPYYRGEPRDAFDRAWRSHDVVERFA
ncbi:MAG TPA: class I SAM-dependent methyltransferase, partial [Chloroflexota bacterium]|nr:class I SAM-dependent methyltransferase [Chloroflexota bacterium]